MNQVQWFLMGAGLWYLAKDCSRFIKRQVEKRKWR